MGILAFVFRAILFLFLLRLVGIVLRAFFGGFVQGARPGHPRGGRGSTASSPPPPRGQVEELVKDPVCGVHTARSSAVVGRFEGSTAYFCSEECAAKAGSS